MAHLVGCCVCVCCVLCFVLPLKQSGVLKCMSVTISHILKNENYELCFWQVPSLIKLQPEKLQPEKRHSRLADCWIKSQITNHLLCQNTNTNYDRKNTTEKKGTVVWLAMFFGGFLRQSNYNQKKLRPEKRYSCLADSWNKSQITVCRVNIRTPITTGKKYDQKKKKCSRLVVGWNISHILI